VNGNGTPGYVISTKGNLSRAQFADWVKTFESSSLTYGNVQAYKALYLRNAAYPQMRVVHPLPPTLAAYRRELYGDQGRDWFPLLGYGLIAAVVALIVDIAWMLS
jgi:hypothetical protein